MQASKADITTIYYTKFLLKFHFQFRFKNICLPLSFSWQGVQPIVETHKMSKKVAVMLFWGLFESDILKKRLSYTLRLDCGSMTYEGGMMFLQHEEWVRARPARGSACVSA